jgi:hypothetical protein
MSSLNLSALARHIKRIHAFTRSFVLSVFRSSLTLATSKLTQKPMKLLQKTPFNHFETRLTFLSKSISFYSIKVKLSILSSNFLYPCCGSVDRNVVSLPAFVLLIESVSNFQEVSGADVRHFTSAFQLFSHFGLHLRRQTLLVHSNGL